MTNAKYILDCAHIKLSFQKYHVIAHVCLHSEIQDVMTLVIRWAFL